MMPNAKAISQFLFSSMQTDVGLPAQGVSTRTSFLSGASQYADGTPATPRPTFRTFEPNEILKSMYSLNDYPVKGVSMKSIFKILWNLKVRTGVPLHYNSKDVSTFGVPVPYGTRNNNVAFFGPPDLQAVGGPYNFYSAVPASLPFTGFEPANMNSQAGLRSSSADIGYQGLNFFLRGRQDYAMDCLNQLGQGMTSMGYGDASYTSRTVSVAILLANVLKQKTVGNIDLSVLYTLLASLQNVSPNGTIPDGYSALDPSTFTGDPIEACNVYMLAVSQHNISFIQKANQRALYDLTTVPPTWLTDTSHLQDP